MNVNVRRMLSSDVEKLARLFMEANPHATFEQIFDWTGKYLAKCPELTFTLEEDGRIVGGISCGMMDADGYIGDIAVREDRRRKGYGTMLMSKALEKFESMKVPKVILGVHWKCGYAIPFYYSLGFRISSVKIDGYGKGHDYVEMEKKLDEE
jgi:ribosomal protein S18 acetylase RimI-like enzyme